MSHIYYPEDQPSAPESVEKSLENISLSGLPPHHLRILRSRIDELLPRDTLKDVNLEAEMVQQLAAAKDLQTRTLEHFDTPANQKAQVLNATTSAIQQLVRMQVDLKRDEQLKRMEAALLKAVATLDPAAQALFFDAYEQLAIAEGVDTNG